MLLMEQLTRCAGYWKQSVDNVDLYCCYLLMATCDVAVLSQVCERLLLDLFTFESSFPFHAPVSKSVSSLMYLDVGLFMLLVTIMTTIIMTIIIIILQ